MIKLTFYAIGFIAVLFIANIIWQGIKLLIQSPFLFLQWLHEKYQEWVDRFFNNHRR